MANIPNADFSNETGLAPVAPHLPGTLVLNIGLQLDKPGLLNKVGDTVQTVERAGFTLDATRVIREAVNGLDQPCEPTVVLEVRPREEDRRDFGVSQEALRALSLVSAILAQDCIAVWVPSEQRGLLVGPNADAWGAFDSRCFFDIDGNTLA